MSLLDWAQEVEQRLDDLGASELELRVHEARMNHFAVVGLWGLSLSARAVVAGHTEIAASADAVVDDMRKAREEEDLRWSGRRRKESDP